MEALCEAVDIVVTDHGGDLGRFLRLDTAQQTEETNLTEVSHSSTTGTHAIYETSDDDEATLNKRSLQLDWRSKKNCSDFTVEVVIVDEDRHSIYRPVQVYHVHRSVLVTGDKRSRYFSKLFQKQHHCTDSKYDNDYAFSRCQIHLDAHTAKALPTFLDYMYSVHLVPSKYFTSENASSLYYLSRILQVDRLRTDVKKFWQNDIALSNCLLYYRHATLLNERKIQEAVLRICIKKLTEIKLQSDILVQYNALPLWLSIIESRHRTHTTNESLRLSILIACFCKLHRELLTFDVFIKLTDTKYLPLIHEQVACPFLDLCKVYEASKKPSVDSQSALLNLRIRCLDSLAKSWDSCVTNGSFHRMLTKLNASELSYLLMTSLATAHDEIGELRSQQKILVDQNAQLHSTRDAVLKELHFVIQDRSICSNELKSMKRSQGERVDGAELEEPAQKKMCSETRTMDASEGSHYRSL